MNAPLGVAALLLGLGLMYWALVGLGLFTKTAAA